MDWERFIYLVNYPESVTPADVPGLEDLTGRYSYFQAVHILLAKASGKSEHIKSAAARTASRKTLRKVIKNEFNLDINLPGLDGLVIEAEDPAFLDKLVASPPENSLSAKRGTAPAQSGSSYLWLDTEPEDAGTTNNGALDEDDDFAEVPPQPEPQAHEAPANEGPVFSDDVEQPLSPEKFEEPTALPVEQHDNTGANDNSEKDREELLEGLAKLKLVKERQQNEPMPTVPSRRQETVLDKQAKSPRPAVEEKYDDFDNDRFMTEEPLVGEEAFEPAHHLGGVIAAPKARTAFKPASQMEIIERYITSEPQLSVKPEAFAPGNEIQDLSKPSVVHRKNAVSENLAVILARQGKKAKAIEIYELLILKYPEKRAYFAAQIGLLQN